MRPLFKELIKGNFPDGFSLEKGETHFYLYKVGNPRKEQIMAFNLRYARNKVKETRCKGMFEFFGWRLKRLNKKTRVWEH
ncbi:MAG: hypothetical protein NT012_03330 [Candidatus Nealsonbacteria bacterium]|jgi:hypothetical protein|nr:hypothetical protein [Candidatus Nealsonbacteria bacterium]